MIRLVIIFVLGLIIIPHIQSETYLSARDDIDDPAERGETGPTEMSTSFTTPPTPPTPEVTSSTTKLTTTIIGTESTLTAIVPSTTTPLPTSSTASTTLSPTTAAITTAQPFRILFRCDFTDSCFGKDQLAITNGSTFNLGTLTIDSEPPRGPTSDVTSINNLTNNNQKCELPFKPQLDNSPGTTTWNTSFCYNNMCPTQNGELATCAPGSYGLISLEPSETTKTVVDWLIPNVVMRDLVGEQCLRFYYYFTVYDQFDWGQQMQVSIRPNNEADKQLSIRNLTVNDMKENKWNFQDITFNSTFANYTLVFVFVVTAENRTEDPLLNKTINFALDNIELYDYNCSYVFDQLTTTISTTTTTTGTTSEATPTTTAESDLALILGLSIGIGVPILIVIIVGLIYYFKVYKPKHKVTPIDTNTTISAVTDIPLVPTNTAVNNKTIPAVVV